MYKLSFEYEFEYLEDDVYFAYCIPYSYSKLMTTLSLLKENTQDLIQEGRLCQSLSGVDVPVVTITDWTERKGLEQRQVVVVTARIHPGETNSSWVMHGFLTFITS